MYNYTSIAVYIECWMFIDDVRVLVFLSALLFLNTDSDIIQAEHTVSITYILFFFPSWEFAGTQRFPPTDTKLI